MGKPEAKVESLLARECARRSWLCWKFTSPNLRGVPDRLVIAPNVVAFVECKSEVGTLRPQQRLRLKEIESKNIATFVCHSAKEVTDAVAHIEKLVELHQGDPPCMTLPKGVPSP